MFECICLFSHTFLSEKEPAQRNKPTAGGGFNTLDNAGGGQHRVGSGHRSTGDAEWETMKPIFLISTSHVTSSERPVMNGPNPSNPLTKKQVFPHISAEKGPLLWSYPGPFVKI